MQVALSPRESSLFPVDKLRGSFLAKHSVRRMNALTAMMEARQEQYKVTSGHSRDELYDETYVKDLFREMGAFTDYMARMINSGDEGTYNSLMTTIDRLDTLIRHFDTSSINPLRAFVSKIERLMRSYHHIEEVCGYFVDLSGTYEYNADDITDDIEVYPMESDAQDLVMSEGEEDSRIYKVIAMVSAANKSSYEKDGMWHIKGRDIFALERVG
jgi:hypothetical protein